MSDHLFSAIQIGKTEKLYSSRNNMSNLTVEGALKFLTTKGFEVSLTLKDEPQREKDAKVIPFPMRA